MYITGLQLQAATTRVHLVCQEEQQAGQWASDPAGFI